MNWKKRKGKVKVMTEHDVWKAAFGRHLDRGDDAEKAVHWANAAVRAYRGGPLGSAGRCENELCTVQDVLAARRPVPGALQGAAIGAAAKQGAGRLCGDEGCPHHGTPHLCVDLEALKRSTVLHDEDPPVPGVYMTVWGGGLDTRRHWDGKLWSQSPPFDFPKGGRQTPEHIAMSHTKWRCLVVADSEVTKPQPADAPQVATVAKQVAEFHEQAAAAKQPRFKFGDRVLVTVPGEEPFYDTVRNVDKHVTLMSRVGLRFSLAWLQHAPEVSHDQC